MILYAIEDGGNLIRDHRHDWSRAGLVEMLAERGMVLTDERQPLYGWPESSGLVIRRLDDEIVGYAAEHRNQ